MTDNLHELAKQMVTLFGRAGAQASATVDDIIQNKDRDSQRIEHQLDHMLGFCCDPDMLLAYKRLCRHYYAIDPQATVAYVNAYRDMWDTPNETEAPQENQRIQGSRAECADPAEAGGLGYEF